jgi:membrane protein
MLFGFRYLIAFVLMVLIITVSLKLYLRGRVEDKKYSKFRVLLPGAVFTTLCWIGFSYGIDIYISMFDGFSTYGSISGVAIAMIWIYFVMYIFLLGVQINYVYRLKIFIHFTPRALFKKNRKSLN